MINTAPLSENQRAQAEVNQGIESGRTAESYFLPEENDFVSALCTDRLPDVEYARINTEILQALKPLVERGEVLMGPGYPGSPSISTISAPALLEFGKCLKSSGVEPWQVAIEEPYIDEGVIPYRIHQNQIGGAKSGVGDQPNEAYTLVFEELMKIGYSHTWGSCFPHVNLYHLLKLSKRYPDLCLASANQPLQIKPVPGVQFFRYGLSKEVSLNGMENTQDEVGWNTHWGDKYNERFKTDLRLKLRGLKSEGKVGSLVMDLGCGSFPLSAQLGGENTIIVLVDKAESVSDLRDRRRIPICANVDSLDKLDIRAALPRSIDAGSHLFVNTVILGDILNYSDNWRVLLEKLKRNFITPGGRVVISNAPDQGYNFALSPNRPRDNLEVLKFLMDDLGCVIEEVHDAAQICGLKDGKLPISRYGQMVVVAQVS